MYVETLKDFSNFTNFSYRSLITYKKNGLIIFKNIDGVEKINVEKSKENIDKYLLLSRTALGTKMSCERKKLQAKKLTVKNLDLEKTKCEQNDENPADVLVSNQCVFIKNENEEKNKIVINNTKKNFENFEDKNDEEIEDEINEDEF